MRLEESGRQGASPRYWGSKELDGILHCLGSSYLRLITTATSVIDLNNSCI